MSVLRIECPHCGTSFDVQLDGEPSNMMVFCCARCKAPLMYFHGSVSELDREEFANLRKRLTRALDAVVARDENTSKTVDAVKKMIEACADELKEPAELPEKNSAITDEMLESLERELNSLDADSFLDKL